MPNSYDQTPYPGLPYRQSHPDRLAALAILLGLNPAPVTWRRALELGCATGGNLIPMAHGLPESHFVGVDFSPRQIDQAQAAADSLGLKNISLKAYEITRR